MEALRGGCQCGAVRYRITGPPSRLAVGHCRDCQRQSGSAFGTSLAVAPTSFTLDAGALRSFEVVCDSGRTKICSFCPRCGTRIHHAGQGGLSVKVGTLDDPSALRPEAHYLTDRKLPWIVIEAGLDCFADDG